MNDIKEKKFMIKIRKQVIFAEKWDLLNSYKKIKVILSVDSSKSRDATLTNVKETDIQTESCFICHKSDHFFRECSDQTSRINALKDDKFDWFTLNSESDSVTVLACVTRKVLGKEVLGHLGGVGQYYRWW